MKLKESVSVIRIERWRNVIDVGCGGPYILTKQER